MDDIDRHIRQESIKDLIAIFGWLFIMICGGIAFYLAIKGVG